MINAYFTISSIAETQLYRYVYSVMPDQMLIWDKDEEIFPNNKFPINIFPNIAQLTGNEDNEAIKRIVEEWWKEASKCPTINALNENIYYVRLALNDEYHRGRFVPHSIFIDKYNKELYYDVYFSFVDEQSGEEIDLSDIYYINVPAYHLVGMKKNIEDYNNHFVLITKFKTGGFVLLSDNTYTSESPYNRNPFLRSTNASSFSNAFAEKGGIIKKIISKNSFDTIYPDEKQVADYHTNHWRITDRYSEHPPFMLTRLDIGKFNDICVSGGFYDNTKMTSYLLPICSILTYTENRVQSFDNSGAYTHIGQFKLNQNTNTGIWIDWEKGKTFELTNFYFDGSILRYNDFGYTLLPKEKLKINWLDKIEFFEEFIPPKIGKLVFTFNLTGMGNDPCKRCCSCEIEEKKYKTVIEFTSDEALEGKVTIEPPELEYEWQDNNLILMLAEGETVTVDKIPAGVQYKISVESEDPCDENEYLIDNAEGTVGEDSEGNPQEETEVNIEAQTGETVEQYLDRLRQRGYEALAESLKLENVEFTLQDERVKLGDLVTVDMPEFDFKAVVRVTGVKLKSQDNQTIRTISVGTPLKILRKPRI